MCSLNATICQNTQRKNRQSDNLNRPIFIKEIESIIDHLLKTKCQDQMGSLLNSIKHLRKKLHQYNPFQDIEAEGILPN